jgi:hypothetical protein
MLVVLVAASIAVSLIVEMLFHALRSVTSLNET